MCVCVYIHIYKVFVLSYFRPLIVPNFQFKRWKSHVILLKSATVNQQPGNDKTCHQSTLKLLGSQDKWKPRPACRGVPSTTFP